MKCFRVVLKVFRVTFLVGMRTLMNPSVFCEFAHKKLQPFYPKCFFAATHEHAYEINLFFVSLLTTTD